MTRGEKVCKFIEKHCRVPEGELVGNPIVLEQFERDFILDVYDNPYKTTLAILTLARKNGKTCLIACLLLAHIAGPEAVQNSQIGSGAMSRDQAALVFKLASKMISLNKDLKSVCRIIPSQKSIIGLALNVEYKALSADSSTAHGLSLVFAILDEIGQVRGPQSDFIDAIITCQGAYDYALLIAISTQAPTDADLLSIWIDDAIKNKDQHTVCHIYEADKDCDLMDEEQWKKANPALGLFRSYEDMKRLAERASRLPTAENSFRNLNLNQRVSIFSPFVSRSTWEMNGAPPDDLSGKVWGGLDLSGKADLTCLCLVMFHGGAWHIHPVFWVPKKGLKERSKQDRVPYDVWVKQGFLNTCPGATVDYSFIAEYLQKTFSATDLQLQFIAFDRWRIDDLKRECEKIGFSMEGPKVKGKPTELLIPYGQGFKDMSPAIDHLESVLANGKARHGMHPVLTMCAANAVITQDAAGNRKFEKVKSTGRIDGMVALAMAIGAALREGEIKDKPKGNDGSLINITFD